jgi:hypothetical protein
MREIRWGLARNCQEQPTSAHTADSGSEWYCAWCVDFIRKATRIAVLADQMQFDLEWPKVMWRRPCARKSAKALSRPMCMHSVLLLTRVYYI